MTEYSHEKYVFHSAESLKRSPKKRRRFRLSRFFVLMLLLLFLSASFFLRKNTAVSDKNIEKAIPLMPQEQDITRLQIQLKEEASYTLLCSKDGALSVENESWFTLKKHNAAAMLHCAQNLHAEETLARPENLSAYGLDAPWLTVTANQTRFQIGSPVPTKEAWYALRDDDPQIYIIPRSAVSSLAQSLNSLHVCPRANRLTDIKITDITIQVQGMETIALSRDAAENSPLMTSFFLTLPYSYPAHSYRVSGDILPALPRLNPSAYAGHIHTPTDRAQYGLLNPFAQIEVSDSSGNQILFCIGKQTGDSRYLTIDDTGDVYLINNSLLDFLSYVRTDYLAEQFPSLIPLKNVKSCTLSFEDGSYLLEISHGNSAPDKFYLNHELLESERGQQLYEQIVSVQHDTVCPMLPADAQTFLSVDFQLLDGQSYLVEYIDVNEDYLAVRANGELHFMVKRNKIEALLSQLAHSAISGTLSTDHAG